MERTTVEVGPAAPQLGKPAALQSYLWDEMKEKFLKGQPKVLGVMQVMTGLMILSIGIIMMSSTLPGYGRHPLSVYIGYSVWGSVMFIISGSFSIAAARRTTKGLVRASLGLNSTSSVFSGTGMIITMISLGISSPYPFNCYYNSSESCPMTIAILIGLDAVILLLSMLEFCVAVSVSSFGCKAICCYVGGVVLVLPSNPQTTEAACPAPLGGDSTAPKDPEKTVDENVP
ncbi:PREDICTED: membrane-spanning 4-domains subfamily A member 4A-like [Chinchilla lanigera]|uniref:Membrane-spanning 4-domains subfamily A member 4A-like n=1 Tax=Chinchilla lanigera TaxID=34839 RepID=A0A8C2UXA9_CHILA|nr:PREDICTED: membrane-spanning 4-domains subfamily A member 4A-like [Chinchilla lanigera]